MWWSTWQRREKTFSPQKRSGYHGCGNCSFYCSVLTDRMGTGRCQCPDEEIHTDKWGRNCVRRLWWKVRLVSAWKREYISGHQPGPRYSRMTSWRRFGVTGPCITNVIATCIANGRAAFSHWLKFLRRVAKTLVIQGPGHLGWESGGFPSQRVSNVAIWCLVCC